MESKKTKIRFLSNLSFISLFFFPIAVVISWSFEPSIRSIVAAASLPKQTISQKTLIDEAQNRDLKRSIQKHFLKFNVYLPLEDIVTILNDSSDQVFAEIMKKACGESRLYLWLPLQIKLPLIKSKTFEYCLRIRDGS